MALNKGQLLQGRYKIIKVLGQGDIGATYHAWDIDRGRPCVIKENLLTAYKANISFNQFSRNLFKMRHQNLVRVSDHFLIPGLGQYLVMDFMPGENLASILGRQDGSIPIEKALEWLSQGCAAIDYLHKQAPPVIHGDIKPANIRLVDTTGGGQKVVLVDYGRPVDTRLGDQAVRSIEPGYAAPEKFRGEENALSDIYALGATAYHLLTGKIPPNSQQRAGGAQLPKPRSLNPSLPAHAENAIIQAMEMVPEKRFASAAQFGDMILGRKPQPVKPQPPLIPPKTVRSEKSSPTFVRYAWMIAAVFLLCAVVALGAFALNKYFGRDQQQARITSGQVQYLPPGGDAYEPRGVDDPLSFGEGAFVMVNQDVASLLLPGNFRLLIAGTPERPSTVELLETGSPGKGGRTTIRLVDGSLVVVAQEAADPEIEFRVAGDSGRVYITGTVLGARNDQRNIRFEVDCFEGLCNLESNTIERLLLNDMQRGYVDLNSPPVGPELALLLLYSQYPLKDYLPASVFQPGLPNILTPTFTITPTITNSFSTTPTPTPTQTPVFFTPGPLFTPTPTQTIEAPQPTRTPTETATIQTPASGATNTTTPTKETVSVPTNTKIPTWTPLFTLPPLFPTDTPKPTNTPKPTDIETSYP